MNRYALIIGINDYEDRDNIQPLRYAVQDARRVDRFFHSCGFKIDTLTDSEATLDSIESKLYEIVDKMESGDVFLFYFSGHGCELSVGRDRKQFLLPRNTQLRSLQFGSGSAIPLRFIQDCTNKSGVSRAIILDCCRSQIRAGVKGTDKSSVHYSSRDIKTTAQSAPESSPLAIICSCHPDYQAYENSSLGGGIFTSAMISVLDDHRKKGQPLGFFSEIQKDIVARTIDILKETDMPLGTSLEPWVEGSAGGVILVPGHSQSIIDHASNVKESSQKEIGVQSIDPRIIQQKIKKWVENRNAEWTKDEWKDFVISLYDDGCAVGMPNKKLEQIRNREKKVWLKAEDVRKAEAARIAEECRKATEEAEKKRKEAEEARKRREEEQLFEEIKATPTIPLCESYLQQYQNGKYKTRVKKILNRLRNKRKYQVKRVKNTVMLAITCFVLIVIVVFAIYKFNNTEVQNKIADSENKSKTESIQSKQKTVIAPRTKSKSNQVVEDSSRVIRGVKLYVYYHNNNEAKDIYENLLSQGMISGFFKRLPYAPNSDTMIHPGLYHCGKSQYEENSEKAAMWIRKNISGIPGQYWSIEQHNPRIRNEKYVYIVFY